MCVISISESCIGLQAVVELRGKGPGPLKDPVASVTSALRGYKGACQMSPWDHPSIRDLNIL